MARRVTKIKLDQAAIASFTLSPAGSVSLWVQKVATRTKVLAAAETKAQTGKRWRNISGQPRMFQLYFAEVAFHRAKSVEWHVKNTSDHALFVLLGTQGPIKRSGGRAMPVGKSQTGAPRGAKAPKGTVQFSRAVDGQEGRNFLFDALITVLAKDGV